MFGFLFNFCFYSFWVCLVFFFSDLRPKFSQRNRGSVSKLCYFSQHAERKGHTKVWMLFAAKGCMQAKSHRKKPSQDGSISASGCTAEKPHLCVYPEEGSLKTNTYTLSMFSQCQYCNISTLIMEMHLGFLQFSEKGDLKTILHSRQTSS